MNKNSYFVFFAFTLLTATHFCSTMDRHQKDRLLKLKQENMMLRKMDADLEILSNITDEKPFFKNLGTFIQKYDGRTSLNEEIQPLIQHYQEWRNTQPFDTFFEDKKHSG